MSLHPDLLDRALSLTPDDRADLARQLILSLDDGPTDPDAAKLWEAEIEARLQQVERGEVAPLDWRESIDKIRRQLKRKESA